jgi:hypothetical protein
MATRVLHIQYAPGKDVKVTLGEFRIGSKHLHRSGLVQRTKIRALVANRAHAQGPLVYGDGVPGCRKGGLHRLATCDPPIGNPLRPKAVTRSHLPVGVRRLHSAAYDHTAI